MTLHINRIQKILLGTIILLLIPFIAMQFTSEVKWTALDFIVAGILLLSVGFVIDFALRKFKTSKYRVAIIIGIIMTFFLIWLELAVGLFGSPLAGS
jgi:predicted membrane channel-forming protein YqfA (hemolysin III family)